MGALEGELGRVAGSEKTVGSDSCQRMAEIAVPAGVCRCTSCEVGCTDWLVFKKKKQGLGGIIYLIYLCCCLPTRCGKHLDRLIICICGKR